MARDKFDAWLATQHVQTKAMLAFKVVEEGGREEKEGNFIWKAKTGSHWQFEPCSRLPFRPSLPPPLPPSPPPSLPIQAEDGTTVKHREGSLEVIPAWGEGGKEGGKGVEKVVLFVRKGGLTVAEPFGEEGGNEGGREGERQGEREGKREGGRERGRENQ